MTSLASMDKAAGAVSEMQEELALAKQALGEGGAFLGMKDKALKQYILQLSEKIFYMQEEGTSSHPAAQSATTDAKTNGHTKTASPASSTVSKKSSYDNYINVQVVAMGPDGEVTDEYTMRATTPFEKMMQAWSKQNEIDVDEARFELNGRVLRPDETPAHFEWSREKGVLVIKATPAEDDDGDAEGTDAGQDPTGMQVREATAIQPEATPAPAPLEESALVSQDGPGADAQASRSSAARESPPGAPETFDRESLEAVGAHLSKYEASAGECGKALRALSSLAYRDPKHAGEQPEFLSQVLRVLALHPKDDHVQLYGMKSLGNMAYDSSVALGVLSSTEVIGTILAAICAKQESTEIKYRASEAVGRLVAAEVGSQGSSSGPADPATTPMLELLVIACLDAADELLRDAVATLVGQLISNGVAPVELPARKLAEVAEICESGPQAEAWLLLAGKLADKNIGHEGLWLSDALTTQGAIPAAQRLMSAHVEHGPAQLAGIEALSCLVGDSMAALQAFADVKGIECIEVAMNWHPKSLLLQTRGVRALAAGCHWPQSILEKAGFSLSRSIQFTKIAMKSHPEAVELQTEALEALVNYYSSPQVEKQDMMEALKKDAGLDIVKSSCQFLAAQPHSVVSDEIRLEANRFPKFVMSA